MGNVKLKGSLPKDEESNGLGERAADEFVDKPRLPRVAIVVLQSESITRSLATSEQVPTVRINRIELVVDPEEAAALVKRAAELSADRTGNEPLEPFQPAEDSSALDFDDEPSNVSRFGKGMGA